MRIRYYLLISLVFSMFSSALFASPIDENEALTKAQQFYTQKCSSLLRSAPAFQLIYTCKDAETMLRSANASAYFYVFNVGNQNGFVIVSGDDATKTILGYSNEGTFSVNNMPENVKSWLDFYRSEIKEVMESGLIAVTSNNTEVSTSLQAASIVSPLLGNIKWNQGDPYNLLCPGGSSSHAVTGCVATAMAQIMKYHEWPATGYGSAQYTTNNYGTLSVDFTKTSYDWSNMLDSYGSTSTGNQDTAVARLMYHCGVSANMEYSTTSSSASINNAATALIDHFGYDADIQMPYRNLYHVTDWKNLVKDELDNARPVLYTGQNVDGGHAFVCDGYDSNDLFHINWGWGGLCNGYFELSSLEPSSAGIGGSIGGYSSDQLILVGIQKEDYVAKATYLPAIFSKGLTSSTSSLTNKSTSFTASFGFLNYGLNSLTGKFGIGLYQNGNLIKELKSSTISQSIKSYSGYSSYPFSISLSGISAGSYQIFCHYQAPNSTSWEIMKCPASLNNYLNVTIATDNSVKITKPASAPTLALTQSIEKLSNIYQNKITKFALSVQNTGTDFYSNIGVNIYSSTGTLVGQMTGVVSIPAGETKSIYFSDSIKCVPGSYFAVAVYDSTNAFSKTAYKKIGPTAYGQIPLTVLAEPSAAALTLSNNISFLNTTSTTIRKSETFTLNVPIRNAGGYFGSKVTAYVFPSSGGYSLTYFSTDAYIDSNTSENIEITGSMEIDPGNYYFSMYYGGDNTSFTPSSYKKLSFTLSEAETVIDNNKTSDFIIYPNPIRDELNIKTSETVIQAQVLDLSGRIMLRFLNTNTLYVNELRPGVYMLRIETENGIKTEKFIKE